MGSLDNAVYRLQQHADDNCSNVIVFELLSIVVACSAIFVCMLCRFDYVCGNAIRVYEVLKLIILIL